MASDAPHRIYAVEVFPHGDAENDPVAPVDQHLHPQEATRTTPHGSTHATMEEHQHHNGAKVWALKTRHDYLAAGWIHLE